MYNSVLYLMTKLIITDDYFIVLLIFKLFVNIGLTSKMPFIKSTRKSAIKAYRFNDCKISLKKWSNF